MDPNMEEQVQAQDPTTTVVDKISNVFGCSIEEAGALAEASKDFVCAYMGDKDVRLYQGVDDLCPGFPILHSEPSDAMGEIARVTVAAQHYAKRPEFTVFLSAYVSFLGFFRRTSPNRPGRFGYVEPQGVPGFATVAEAVAFIREETARVHAMAESESDARPS